MWRNWSALIGWLAGCKWQVITVQLAEANHRGLTIAIWSWFTKGDHLWQTLTGESFKSCVNQGNSFVNQIGGQTNRNKSIKQNAKQKRGRSKFKIMSWLKERSKEQEEHYKVFKIRVDNINSVSCMSYYMDCQRSERSKSEFTWIVLHDRGVVSVGGS